MKIPVLAGRLALALLGCAAGACDSTPDFPKDMLSAPPPREWMTVDHRGPEVAAGAGGPSRYLAVLAEDFDTQAAMQSVRFVDGFYRAPANDGYNAVLDHIAVALREVGFGTDAQFRLEVFESELEAAAVDASGRTAARAWTPLSARIVLRTSVEPERVLHLFADAGDRDRVMLPINTPSANVEGEIALNLEELSSGEILACETAPSKSVLARARSLGAAAIVSASLEGFNADPTGKDRHRDAIQFRTLPVGTEIPVVQISPASLERIREARAKDPRARLAIDTKVRFDDRKLRTLVATIVGTDRPDEAIVTVSHVQEPGACDNASGVAGLLESARSIARLTKSGKLPRASRSLAFVWGDEMRQSTVWLEQSKRRAIAGLSSDMTGESRERTGAIALLERQPDPGALTPLAPDEHTPWGAGKVEADQLKPAGVAVVARCAMADVATREAGWTTAEHPWEGGSDHDVFIQRGIPAALFWHFTDFAYHTSLDRLENVDATELRRTAIALSATALALADPKPEDLDRYLATNNHERVLRVQAAVEAKDEELAQRWRVWTDGVREWLRVECLRIPPVDEKAGKPPVEKH
jgi:hypothetical protein